MFLIVFFLLVNSKYFNCNSTNCQVTLDYPVPMCFNISKDNQAINCDHSVLTVIDYYHMYEGFKFIGFIPKQSHFNLLMSKAEVKKVKVDNSRALVKYATKICPDYRFYFIVSWLIIIFFATGLILNN